MLIHQREEPITLLETQPITGYDLEDSIGELLESMKMEQLE